MTQEERIAQLELALDNLLECFDETPEGIEVELADGGIGYVTDTTEETLIQAREVLDHDDVEN
jgi:hypothetical protein